MKVTNMKRSILLGIAAILGLAAAQSDAVARGFGGGGFGGSHGGSFGGGFDRGGFGGGGFGGSRGGGLGGGEMGGSRAGGFDTGAARPGGFDSGGFRTGGFDTGAARAGGYGAGGFRTGGLDAGGVRGGQAGADGFRAGGYGGSLNRGELNSFLGLPTDGGMHAAAGDYGARGTVAGTGRATAGGYVAGRGYAAAYGTRAFSPTYFHAQGLAAQRWCNVSGVFTPAWCGAHPWAWCPAGYAGAAWATAAWRPATWPALGTWLTWNATPGYYDYGNNITYQDNYVYYGTQPVETQQQYYQQALGLAGASASPTPSVANTEPNTDAQWLPLGVFGLMAEGQGTPTMVFQLAIDKAGAIRGNYYDQVSDNTVPVTGTLNKTDQRVAWRVGSNKNLVIETGLYNLTQDHSTALVHYGPDQTQQYVLVRMKQPEGQGDQK